MNTSTPPSFEGYVEDMIDRAIAKKLDLNAADELKMVKQHGEQISYKKAAELLHRSTQTIHRWADAGLLQSNGHGVSVRSIARFLQMPPEKQKPPRKYDKLPEYSFRRRLAQERR